MPVFPNGKYYRLPEGYRYFRDVAYKDGSPVIFKLNEPFTIKVGKRVYAEITITGAEDKMKERIVYVKIIRKITELKG